MAVLVVGLLLLGLVPALILLSPLVIGYVLFSIVGLAVVGLVRAVRRPPVMMPLHP